jgi:hypothetical protein
MVHRRRFMHLAILAAVIVAAVVVLAIVDQVALAGIVGTVGIILIGAAVPFFAIDEDEHPRGR